MAISKVPFCVLFFFVVLLACCSAAAQQTRPSNAGKRADAGDGVVEASNTTESLQKATQNPVANLISVPLQNNSNFGAGPFNRTQDVLNIQPVIPAKLTDRWNLISRIIQPIVWQPILQRQPVVNMASAT